MQNTGTRTTDIPENYIDFEFDNRFKIKFILTDAPKKFGKRKKMERRTNSSEWSVYRSSGAGRIKTEELCKCTSQSSRLSVMKQCWTRITKLTWPLGRAIRAWTTVGIRPKSLRLPNLIIITIMMTESTMYSNISITKVPLILTSWIFAVHFESLQPNQKSIHVRINNVWISQNLFILWKKAAPQRLFLSKSVSVISQRSPAQVDVSSGNHCHHNEIYQQDTDSSG